MNFFEQFLHDIKAIGGEFLDRFKNIPTALETVKAQLPTALTGFVVVLVMLAIIAVAILIFSKIMSVANKKSEKKEEAPVKTEKAGTPLPENTSAGSLVTTDVDEKTAAVIMAIVSKESGIPLNRLSFKSIKLMEEK
ncbi:MAG: OadG family protein [Clostridia bacterium]|nr:OadG family protein [Clostridia bacterium]